MHVIKGFFVTSFFSQLLQQNVMLLLCLPYVTSALRIGVVGAHGGLGRELVQQSLTRGHHPIAFTRRSDPIPTPVRSGWLSPDASAFTSPMQVSRGTYDTPPPTMDALVIALSGSPFARDTTTEVVRRMCTQLPSACRSVTLVSAWGVGDSIHESNAGIQWMRDVYLRSTYSAK